ncbi:type III secretion system inner membrane ring subunit SctD [Chitinimonas lacunae]|uniref:Type III secretion system inner membrane ring subunit SctD n=1 Tax=Chitinimonas lacunae TaxID=1963018 RepID=A0ABV8MSW2_9NEIS
MTTARLELRVLHGPQAGARLPLSDGRYLLGSGERADIVLHGPAVAAEHCALDLDGDIATLEPIGGSLLGLDGRLYERGDRLALGVVVEIGGVWLCLDRPDASWPARVEPVQSPQPKDVAAEPGATTAPPAAAAPPPAPGKESPPLGRRLGQAALSGLALAAIVTVALVWLAGAGKSTPPVTSAKPADQGRARLEAAIAAAGVGPHLRWRRLQDSWIIEGHVSDDASRARLARAVAALPQRVALRVYADDALLADGRAALAGTALPLRLEGLGGGAFRLSGAAPDQASVDDTVERLREDVAGLKRIDNAVLLPDALASRLLREIEQAGLGSRIKSIRRPDGTLELSGTLAAADLARWEKLFGDFSRDYGAVLPVRASFARLQPPLPFRIRGVVGGEQPYVLTADGAKITVGGQIGAYKLVAVTDRELIFDGPERVSLAR